MAYLIWKSFFTAQGFLLEHISLFDGKADYFCLVPGRCDFSIPGVSGLYRWLEEFLGGAGSRPSVWLLEGVTLIFLQMQRLCCQLCFLGGSKVPFCHKTRFCPPETFPSWVGTLQQWRNVRLLSRMYYVVLEDVISIHTHRLPPLLRMSRLGLAGWAGLDDLLQIPGKHWRTRAGVVASWVSVSASHCVREMRLLSPVSSCALLPQPPGAGVHEGTSGRGKCPIVLFLAMSPSK